MDKRKDIEKVHEFEQHPLWTDIPVPNDADNDGISDQFETPVEGQKVYLAFDRDSETLKVVRRVLEVFAGENKLGKDIGEVKDAITYIFPQVKPLDDITDKIGDYLKRILNK